MKKYVLILSVILLIGVSAIAQKKTRFANDVQTIQRYDKIFEISGQPILFVGSSSIRKWKTLQQDFCSYEVLNRGLGGFITADLIHYAEQLIFKYTPRQLVIYVGDNDIAETSATADTIFERFKILYKVIRSKLPDVPIEYISIKPSPAREQYYQKAKDANKLISEFIKKQSHIHYIDVFTEMSKKGHSRPELFGPDSLHMNAEGYKIWVKKVKPFLLH